MNKAVVITIIALTMVLGLQCTGGLVPELNAPAQNAETLNETQLTSENAGLVYMNTETDVFTYITEPDWYYDSDGTMVVFYNENASYHSSSIALSSHESIVDKKDRDDRIAWYLDSAKENITKVADNTVWVEAEDFIFGDFTGYRFYYTGNLIPDGEVVHGEYIYWWIGDRLYICSMFASEDDYEQFIEVMHSLLFNFAPPSSMN